MSRSDKLWSELSKEEKQEEKKEFMVGWMVETGDTQEVASLMWGEYLNQEGYTSRDEQIAQRRDLAYEAGRLR